MKTIVNGGFDVELPLHLLPALFCLSVDFTVRDFELVVFILLV